MSFIIVDSRDWSKLISDIAAIKTQLTAINAAIALLGHLTPDQQAKLNKIFDTATADSAKIDAALSAQPTKDKSHG